MNNKSLKIAYSPLKHTGNKFFQLTQDCINFEKNINILWIFSIRYVIIIE